MLGYGSLALVTGVTPYVFITDEVWVTLYISSTRILFNLSVQRLCKHSIYASCIANHNYCCTYVRQLVMGYADSSQAWRQVYRWHAAHLQYVAIDLVLLLYARRIVSV
jgi:hypothetical protein